MDPDIKYFWKNTYSPYTKQERFNLLLLEPGEIYFEDFSVYYYSSECKAVEAIKKQQKGRLKLCSKSLVFDPVDAAYPILKFLYKDVTEIGKRCNSLLSRQEQKGDIIALECKLCVSMKAGNLIAPYTYIRERRKYYFSLNFVNINGVLPRIEQLLRANTLNPHESSSMISAIVDARQASFKFNTSWIEDLYEDIVYETTASKISPLVCNPGRILLTSKQIYFQPFNNVESELVVKVKLIKIEQIIKRRYLLRHVGLEIFQRDNKSDLYFIFTTPQERNTFYDHVLVQEELSLVEKQRDNMTLKWQNGALSNFDYLMHLNSVADRSFNDLTQYPVLPWIIKDYTSKTLDLQNPETFRDLSKPIGALDEQRLKQLKQRCNGMPEPKFLYGSHYSTPGFVLYYLVRVAPEYMLCLQNGKFDKADRLFNSILPTWHNCCTGHSDFKELIPEFYESDGSFLCNSKNLRLGIKQDGERVHDVELPPWADGPQDFISKCRQALECDYVSQELHNWIDLVFGYKQTGDEAWKADNVFYYLTYEGAIDLESIENENDRKCYESQILEFGQTPKQLFTKPHPKRQTSGITISTTIEVQSLISDEKLLDIPVVKLYDELEVDTTVELQGSKLSWVTKLSLETSCKLHKDHVYGIEICEDKKTISVSQDTQVKMYSISDKQQIRSMNLSAMALSCCQLIDENNLLIGSWDNNIYTYSIEYSRVVNELHAHDDAVSSLSYVDDTLATSSWDSTVKVWTRCKSNRKSPFTLVAELDHDTEVTCCNLRSRDDDDTLQLVSGTKDGHISVWNIELQVITFHHAMHTDEVTAVLFAPDGERVLSCSLDGFMKILDISTEVEVYSKHVGDGIRCACWNDNLVIAGCESGDIMIWDLLKVTCVTKLQFHQGPVHCLTYHDKDRLLLSGDSEGYIAVWS